MQLNLWYLEILNSYLEYNPIKGRFKFGTKINPQELCYFQKNLNILSNGQRKLIRKVLCRKIMAIEEEKAEKLSESRTTEEAKKENTKELEEKEELAPPDGRGPTRAGRFTKMESLFTWILDNPISGGLKSAQGECLRVIIEIMQKISEEEEHEEKGEENPDSKHKHISKFDEDSSDLASQYKLLDSTTHDFISPQQLLNDKSRIYECAIDFHNIDGFIHQMQDYTYEPPFTSYTNLLINTDYIWYNATPQNKTQIQVSHVFHLPPLSTVFHNGMCPNQIFPSDHFPIAAKFYFK